MPKKFAGENSKAVEARARKSEVKKNEQERVQKAKEDAKWVDDDKLIARKLARKEEEEKKRQEQLKKKQELKQAYEEDMNAAVTSKAKPAPKPKVTQLTLYLKREAERKAREEEEKKKQEQAQKIVVPAEEIEQNLNQLDIGDSARNIDEAIKVLDNSTDSVVDKHPEKRMKAAYLAFEERRLKELKQENPTLRLSQIKQMLKKEWNKSPENPLNQV